MGLKLKILLMMSPESLQTLYPLWTQSVILSSFHRDHDQSRLRWANSFMFYLHKTKPSLTQENTSLTANLWLSHCSRKKRICGNFINSVWQELTLSSPRSLWAFLNMPCTVLLSVYRVPDRPDVPFGILVHTQTHTYIPNTHSHTYKSSITCFSSFVLFCSIVKPQTHWYSFSQHFRNMSLVVKP